MVDTPSPMPSIYSLSYDSDSLKGNYERGCLQTNEEKYDSLRKLICDKRM